VKVKQRKFLNIPFIYLFISQTCVEAAAPVLQYSDWSP
jgi:hypothetical protein